MAGFFKKLGSLFSFKKKETTVEQPQESIESLLKQNQERLLTKPKEDAQKIAPDPVRVIPMSVPKKVCELDKEDTAPRAKFNREFQVREPKKTSNVIYHMPNFVTGLNAYESTSESES